MISNKLSLDGDWDVQLSPQQNTEATPQAEWRSVLVSVHGRRHSTVIAQALFDGMLRLL